ncbi:MAG TPA: lipopolysaccharide kinase InaA family protein [Tepidisphaeraceae bacterium]|nr:lipopolysaccharide kinase InaA family protein [Tepidisphaeraceae bacterium]
MSVAELEQSLRDLPRVGKLVKDRGYRQVWRFAHGERAYYLKFYPRAGVRDRIRRLFRGSPALAEFTRLQRLQTAKIPSPRAVAVLIGFSIAGRSGDAVILDAIEPGVQLDQYFNELELRGEPLPDHLDIARQIRDLVRQLVKARLGHEDLHLGNFLMSNGKIYLLDGYAIRTGGMSPRHLLHLGHSVSRYATLTDLLRGWYDIGPGRGHRMPAQNRVSSELSRDFIRRRIDGENRYFGRISMGNWAGAFFKLEKFPRRWSPASALNVSHDDWNRELPRLLDLLDKDQLHVVKRSRSGDVLTANVTLGEKNLDVIIKRSRKRYWYRYFNEIGRGSRARRAWVKAWKIILRNLPTAWPLLYAENRRLGYVTDALVIFERVAGTTLARADLDSMTTPQRDMLFRRTGRILRKIDRLGLAHFDAKASNWMVRPDETLGPSPVMIDIDGIRERRWTALGIQRLLKSVREINKQYSVPDSLSLCQGYAPTAAPRREGAEEKPQAVEAPGDPGDNGAKVE